jgi:type I restriction enzyme S subunit
MNKVNKPVLGTVEGLMPELRFPEFVNDGEWEGKAFEELFEIGNGRDYKHLEKGKIPVYGSGGYMLSVDDFLYDGESVCIGRKGTIDKPMFLEGKFWTVDTLFFTHSFKDCLPKYIFFVFQNINWLNHNEAGGVPSLTKTNIYKIETLIPKPQEQQKIASCLSSLDDLITAQSQKLDLLKDHKKGLMQNLFPQEGEKVPKFRFQEFENDGEWVEKTIDKVKSVLTDYVANGSFQSLRENLNVVNTVDFAFYVRLTDLRGGLGHSNQKYVDESTYKFLNKSALFGGELLMANIGANVGEVWQMPNVNKPATLAPNMIMIKLKKDIDSGYVFQYLTSDIGVANISTVISGSGHPKISKTDLRQVKVTLPPRIKEQQKIASCLSSLDALITSLTEKISQLKLHKNGLMQRLFPRIND